MAERQWWRLFSFRRFSYLTRRRRRCHSFSFSSSSSSSHFLWLFAWVLVIVVLLSSHNGASYFPIFLSFDVGTQKDKRDLEMSSPQCV
jgi:hypothetical protein